MSRWRRETPPLYELPPITAPVRPVLVLEPEPAPKPKRTRKPKAEPAPKPEKPDKEQRLAEVTDDAVAAYNAILAKPHGKLPVVTSISIERRRDEVKRSVRAISRICDELYGESIISPKFWEQYFTECKRDDFLSGYGGYSEQHKNWTPDFEYLTREKTVTKVFERAMSR